MKNNITICHSNTNVSKIHIFTPVNRSKEKKKQYEKQILAPKIKKTCLNLNISPFRDGRQTLCIFRI